MESVLIRILYWLAVLVVSLALLVALVLFFESRDPTSVDGGGAVLLGGLSRARAARESCGRSAQRRRSAWRRCRAGGTR